MINYISRHILLVLTGVGFRPTEQMGAAPVTMRREIYEEPPTPGPEVTCIEQTTPGPKEKVHQEIVLSHETPATDHQESEVSDLKANPVDVEHHIESPKNTPKALKFEHEATLLELGLGTGLNLTDSNMWADRSIRKQVREVSPNQTNIRVSEFCNEVANRVDVVTDVRAHQMEITAALNDPFKQIKIGVHAETSRKEDSEMKTFYKKIHTRSVSFEDSTLDELPEAYRRINSNASLRTTEQFQDNYFQMTLSLWVMSKCELPPNESEDPIAQLEEYMKDSSAKEKVTEACEKYVKVMRITHYVSSIDLGALHHGACTVKEYQERFGGGVKVEASVVHGGLEGQVSKMLRRSTSEDKKVGDVDNVIRGTTKGEGVIAFRIQPIHSLVSGVLQEVLHNAVKKYIDESMDRVCGMLT